MGAVQWTRTLLVALLCSHWLPHGAVLAQGGEAGQPDSSPTLASPPPGKVYTEIMPAPPTAPPPPPPGPTPAASGPSAGPPAVASTTASFQPSASARGISVLHMTFSATSSARNTTLTDGLRVALSRALGVPFASVDVACTAAAASPWPALSLQAGVSFATPEALARAQRRVLAAVGKGVWEQQVLAAMPAAARRLLQGLFMGLVKATPAQPATKATGAPARPVLAGKPTASQRRAVIRLQAAPLVTLWGIECRVSGVTISGAQVKDVVAFTVEGIKPATRFSCNVWARIKEAKSPKLVVPITTLK